MRDDRMQLSKTHFDRDATEYDKSAKYAPVSPGLWGMPSTGFLPSLISPDRCLDDAHRGGACNYSFPGTGRPH
jgi:hypothetical protein